MMIFPLFAVLVPALALADSPSAHLIVTTINHIQTGVQLCQTLSDSVLISSTVEPNGLTRCHYAPATPVPCLLPAEGPKSNEGTKGTSTVLVKMVTIEALEDNRDQTQVIVEQPELSAAQWNLSLALNFSFRQVLTVLRQVVWNLRDVLLYAVSIGAQIANQSLVNVFIFTWNFKTAFRHMVSSEEVAGAPISKTSSSEGRGMSLEMFLLNVKGTPTRCVNFCLPGL
ncbi:uncharacterized protein EI90DRAFT_1945547 [Cantharellus anzutake]|uniref:uncharacterized protein n=1 Tax=Cantharellus anzutake TaxID=1750568 RepID=UPI00190803FE|nr:uncharacterized protein EI90DRAFT_1945547 [Cantharellus anzutake]KAF8326364.1 hypothetical protein EI90DRAFT_1945547 [Cantharellus anzutake]